ncbi:STAS/SEC14 domain-containing protein [Haloarcula sp. GH36]|uniref:STAS/SEC14 domain-containing protein n=1 Tax=Haloarcula montana TaxID=3111776 RepID=UPI002D78C3C3|nr:STAS/SEC14 domain-containing protein [Haloarcula sp. GH36]
MAQYESAFLTIEWDGSIEAVIMNWTDFAEGEEYREGLNKGLEVIEQHGAENWLADLREMGAVSQEDQEWTRNEWHPRAFETSLTNMAIIQPESVVAEMSVDDLVQEIGEETTIQIFDNREDAKTWLDEQ